MVKILDCTTRDGGFCTNWEFQNQYVHSLIDCLQKSDIKYFEIGYRNFFEKNDKGKFFYCDKNFLNQFCENKGELQIGIMVDVKRYSPEDFADRSNDNIDFIRIACRTHEIEQSINIAEILHSKGYKVFIQLMEALKIDTVGYINLFKWRNKNILESLYFADSYGEMTPTQVEEIFNKLRVIGYEKISFHAHNNSNQALDNTLKAINLGAFSVDITHNGIGRGGNLDASDLLSNLNRFTPQYYKDLDNVLLQN